MLLLLLAAACPKYARIPVPNTFAGWEIHVVGPWPSAVRSGLKEAGYKDVSLSPTESLFYIEEGKVDIAERAGSFSVRNNNGEKVVLSGEFFARHINIDVKLGNMPPMSPPQEGPSS